MNANNKITDTHLQKTAFIYIRQSSMGYVYDQANRIVKDPDAQVRSAIELLFGAFEQAGSAYAVVQRFAREKLLFPKRSYGGAWAGKLLWGRLTDSRVLAILRNPSYAGVYAFGRYQTVKEILDNGEVRSKIRRMPRDQWLVEILDHHDGYTSFEQHLSNLDTLERNRTNPKEAVLSGPAREGLALLQGLLVCSYCGRRLTVRYRGNGGIYPVYECNWRKREGLSKTSCLHVQCGYLDRAIERRVLEVVEEEQLNLALDAYDIVQQRQQQIDTQWKLRLERAEYEAQLAQRRYEEVDPSNRLVASTLEQRWNDALIELEDVRNQIADLQQRNTLTLVTNAPLPGRQKLPERHQLDYTCKWSELRSVASPYSRTPVCCCWRSMHPPSRRKIKRQRT